MSKLQSLPRLKEILAEEKKKGRRIVLANGCFDLIHAGHVRYLREARSRGDLLVLALNSDASVRHLKGPGRPILSQEERAEILASFSAVDHILIFDEPNVEHILLSLRPDVHAKGSDYSLETVPEKDTSSQIGARVDIAGGPKIHNTSDIIRAVAEGVGNDAFLIVRLSSLGDIIHALPAFAALRRRRPAARISWAVGPGGKKLLDLVRGLDSVIVLGRDRLRKSLEAERRSGLISLDFQGLLKSAFIGWRSGAGRRLGFDRRNLREPAAALFYTERPSFFPESDHVMAKNLHLLTCLGIGESRFDFPLDIPRDAGARVRQALASLGFRSGQALILANVGAAWRTKRWFAERWAGFLRAMKGGNRFLLLLWGGEEEKALAEQAGRLADVPPAPFFDVAEVLALLKECDLLVSGDTFALQAACALDVPVVGLFGPTTPSRNGPFLARDRVAFHELPCSHCYRRSCAGLECLKRISVEEVVALARGVLEEAGRG